MFIISGNDLSGFVSQFAKGVRDSELAIHRTFSDTTCSSHVYLGKLAGRLMLLELASPAC